MYISLIMCALVVAIPGVQDHKAVKTTAMEFCTSMLYCLSGKIPFLISNTSASSAQALRQAQHKHFGKLSTSTSIIAQGMH